MRFRLLAVAGALATCALAQSPAPPAPASLYCVRFTSGPAWDTAKSPNEQDGMPEHSANLGQLRRNGAIVLGARFGDTGLVVFRAPDAATVDRYLEPDPTLRNGVFTARVDAFQPFYHGHTRVLDSEEAVLLRAYLDAFNRQEPGTIAALCAEDFIWYGVEGGTLAPEVQGRSRLHEWLTGYFKSLPSVRSEFLSIEQTGAFLSVRERSTWTNRAGVRVSQQALGIYEVRDGLIRRAWYFPSTPDAR